MTNKKPPASSQYAPFFCVIPSPRDYPRANTDHDFRTTGTVYRFPNLNHRH